MLSAIHAFKKARLVYERFHSITPVLKWSFCGLFLETSGIASACSLVILSELAVITERTNGDVLFNDYSLAMALQVVAT